MTYILWIAGSTVLFSIQFLFKKLFQKGEGSSAGIAIMSSLLSTVFAILLLVARGKTAFEFSWFSFTIAFLHALRAVAMSFMSIKVLEKANLSVFSLFSQLGGTLLPFLFAIIFYGESLTWQKSVCMLLLAVAMYCDMSGRKKGKDDGGKRKSSGIFWCMGVFVLNGLAGVFAKIHQSAPDAIAVSSSAYTMLEKVISLVLSALLMVYFIRRGESVKLKRPVGSVFYIGAGAVLNTVANLILLAALEHVDASVQYPIVTGGIIVLSLLLEPLSGSRPKKHTVIAAAVSLVGLIFLAF
ncbi:MAG: EamA family transporter [Clostridia bacterium]|nr:EamA family transporter [Clostridia bacterium]